jgi:hypothetical protein
MDRRYSHPRRPSRPVHPDMIFGYRAGLLPTRCWSDHASPGLQLWCKSLIFSGVVTTRFAEKPLINKGWHGSENRVGTRIRWYGRLPRPRRICAGADERKREKRPEPEILPLGEYDDAGAKPRDQTTVRRSRLRIPARSPNKIKYLACIFELDPDCSARRNNKRLHDPRGDLNFRNWLIYY